MWDSIKSFPEAISHVYGGQSSWGDTVLEIMCNIKELHWFSYMVYKLNLTTVPRGFWSKCSYLKVHTWDNL